MNSYFSHDSNARNSEKLIKVRMTLGAEGYGIYFMILERLREEKNYMSVKDYNVIAFDLRVDASSVKKVVEDFGLFVFTEDGKYFYSESFLRRMSIKDEKSRKRSEAGKLGAAKRWGKPLDENNKNGNKIASDINNNSNAMAMPSKKIASKVKESKEKNSNKNNVQNDCTVSVSKTDINNFFESVWKLYPVKKGKGQVSDAKKKRLYGLGYDAIAKCIDRYNAELEKDNEWRKPQNGSTFFNSGYVDYLDENYEPSMKSKKVNNSFNNFEQRDYSKQDIDDLEKKLLRN